MRTDTQRVSTWTGDSQAPAPDRVKTDWCIVQPALRGGGAITVDLPPGLAIDLVPEHGDRVRATRTTSDDGRSLWTWPAPAHTQLCRFVVTRKAADAVAVPEFVVVAQQVEDPSPHEHTIFLSRGTGYRSKLFQIKSHSPGAGDSLLTATAGEMRFVPCDPRDTLLTRFLSLAPGLYELRLRWPRGTDLETVLVRPQNTDYSWLPAAPILSDSGTTVTLTVLFEVPHPRRDVRFHLLLPGRRAELPGELELVRLTSETRVAGARLNASSPQEGAINPAADNALRWLAGIPDEAGLVPVLQSMTEASLQRVLADDPWLHNYARNAWEFVHRRTVLTTYPPDVCIPIADVCNARCTFCTSWLEGTRITTLEEIDGFEEVLRYARWLGLAGHGEPLAHPRIREILTRLATWLDSRATAYVITNGIYLSGLMDDLIRSRVRQFAISLNAATAATHREVMGLPKGSFEDILESIRGVVARRETHGTTVSTSMVITQQNLPEVPAFIELANTMGVDRIQLKTLAPVGGPIEGLNFHLLPPYEHPDYPSLKANAVAAIHASSVPVQVDIDSWDVSIFPPDVERTLRVQTLPIVSRDEAVRNRQLRETWRSQPKYHEKTSGRVLEEVLDFDGINPFGRTTPFACRAPYRHLYINDFSFNLSPCCYLPGVPGSEPAVYAGSGRFMEAWNSDALVTLRRRLSDGPLFNMCTKCPGTY
jgi:MoaA/NifB/PqqE/SkfB family radical SAM enzyme